MRCCPVSSRDFGFGGGRAKCLIETSGGSWRCARAPSPTNQHRLDTTRLPVRYVQYCTVPGPAEHRAPAIRDPNEKQTGSDDKDLMCSLHQIPASLKIWLGKALNSRGPSHSLSEPGILIQLSLYTRSTESGMLNHLSQFIPFRSVSSHLRSHTSPPCQLQQCSRPGRSAT